MSSSCFTPFYTVLIQVKVFTIVILMILICHLSFVMILICHLYRYTTICIIIVYGHVTPKPWSSSPQCTIADEFSLCNLNNECWHTCTQTVIHHSKVQSFQGSHLRSISEIKTLQNVNWNHYHIHHRHRHHQYHYRHHQIFFLADA